MKKYSSGAFCNEITVAGNIDVTKRSGKATKPTVCWSENFNCYKQLVVFEPQMIIKKKSEMLSTDVQA